MTMWEIQIQTLVWTIEKHRGDKAAAAKELDIGLTTAYRWLKKHERVEALKASAAQRSTPPSHVSPEGALQ